MFYTINSSPLLITKYIGLFGVITNSVQKYIYFTRKRPIHQALLRQNEIIIFCIPVWFFTSSFLSKKSPKKTPGTYLIKQPGRLSWKMCQAAIFEKGCGGPPPSFFPKGRMLSMFIWFCGLITVGLILSPCCINLLFRSKLWRENLSERRRMLSEILM